MTAQPALARFIASGSFSHHVQDTGSRYAARCELIVHCLNRYLNGYAASQETSSLNLEAYLDAGTCEQTSDIAVSDHAASVGVVAAPLSRYYARMRARRGQILGFAGYPEQQLLRATQLLATALGHATEATPVRLSGSIDSSILACARTTFMPTVVRNVTHKSRPWMSFRIVCNAKVERFCRRGARCWSPHGAACDARSTSAAPNRAMPTTVCSACS